VPLSVSGVPYSLEGDATNIDIDALGPATLSIRPGPGMFGSGPTHNTALTATSGMSVMLFATVVEVVPRDAILRLLFIQGVATLDQYEQTREEGSVRVSTVSVIVLTQIEFSDPQTGFQRLDGTNEWTFRVTKRLGGR